MALIYYVIHRFYKDIHLVIYRCKCSETTATQARFQNILWQFARHKPRYICHCSFSSEKCKILLYEWFDGFTAHPRYKFFSHIRATLLCCLLTSEFDTFESIACEACMWYIPIGSFFYRNELCCIVVVLKFKFSSKSNWFLHISENQN